MIENQSFEKPEGVELQYKPLPLRIFYYSHDSYGLGHLRRSLAIASQLSLTCPDATQLLVTGSPQSHSFELPEGLDIIKLPSISKSESGEYQSRSLKLPFKALKTLRETIILECIRHFEPDIVLVDKSAAGVSGEMRPSLSYLHEHRPKTKVVLGMRDIEDEPEKVRKEWAKQGIYTLMEERCHRILLYGNRAIYDPVKHYALCFSRRALVSMLHPHDLNEKKLSNAIQMSLETPTPAVNDDQDLQLDGATRASEALLKLFRKTDLPHQKLQYCRRGFPPTPQRRIRMRIFYYSHDTYGLGHIQRTLAIARQVALDCPEATQLLITGSPQAHSFELPDRLDIIKLPSISKSSKGEYRSRTLRIPFKALKALRETIILETIRHFKPDVVLVDKAPAGVKGEMLPAFAYLKEKRPETKCVLGMRDIEDDATKVCEDWKRQRLYHLMDETYDAIFLYGNRAIYDPVKAYRLSAKTERKIISCGYIVRNKCAKPPEEIRRALKMKTDRLVLVTAGGGEDGFHLMNTYLKMLADQSHSSDLGFDSLIVPGPLMSNAERKKLHAYRAMGLPMTLLDFTPDLYNYLNAADLIVSMGGYNTFCEIISLGKKSIIVPRVRPRVEQLIRAKRFSELGLVRMLHPTHLNPANLFMQIQNSFKGDNPISASEAGLTINGAMEASRSIKNLLKEVRPPEPYVSYSTERLNQIKQVVLL